MPEDEKINEVLTLLRMLDTKIRFLEEDVSELKEMLVSIGNTNVECFSKLLTDTPKGTSAESKYKIEKF